MEEITGKNTAWVSTTIKCNDNETRRMLITKLFINVVFQKLCVQFGYQVAAAAEELTFATEVDDEDLTLVFPTPTCG